MPYERILVLSYYHPWVAGGGHRPRRLMAEDLSKGRTVSFAFVSDDGVADVESGRRNEPSGNALSLFQSTSTGEFSDVRLVDDKGAQAFYSADELLERVRPDMVRVHNPSSAHVAIAAAAQKRHIAVHYDIMDLWTAFSETPWGTGAEDWYLKHADLVTSVSHYMITQHTQREIHVVPNAVPKNFIVECRAAVAASAKPERPIAVYVGALWPDWIDWQLIDKLVSRLPWVDFLFVGALSGPSREQHGTGAELRSNAPPSNVVYLDEMPHQGMIRHLVRAKVGILPFVRNPLTLAASPLKVFDYLAADLPVVSSDLSELYGYPNVECCAAHDDFIAAVAQRCMQPPSTSQIADSRAFVDASVWRSRSDHIDQLIRMHCAATGE